MRNYGIAWRRFILLQKCQINGRTLFAPTYKQRIYVDCRGRRPRRPACLSLLQHSCIACRRFIFFHSKRALHVSCVRSARFVYMCKPPIYALFCIICTIARLKWLFIFLLYITFTLYIYLYNIFSICIYI